MFVIKDRLLRGCARGGARRSLATVESPAVLATSGQTRTYTTQHQTPTPAATHRCGTPPREVVIPRPEGRGICFSSAREPFASLVFSNLRARFFAQKPQPPHNHSLAHYSLSANNITALFPATSALLRRPRAPERKSTPVFSIACTLFCKNTGGIPRTAGTEPEPSPVAAPGGFSGSANLRIGGLELLTRRRTTPAFFPASSALLPLSVAPERKSTPVFSIACTLFCESTGGTPRPVEVAAPAAASDAVPGNANLRIGGFEWPAHRRANQTTC